MSEFRNKYAKFRNDKKNKKSQIKLSHKNKYSFIDDEFGSNINDIPESIRKNNSKINHIDDNISTNCDNNITTNTDTNINTTENNIYNNISINIDNLIEQEYSDEEEFTPDYFEPVAYVKK